MTQLIEEAVSVSLVHNSYRHTNNDLSHLKHILILRFGLCLESSVTECSCFFFLIDLFFLWNTDTFIALNSIRYLTSTRHGLLCQSNITQICKYHKVSTCKKVVVGEILVRSVHISYITFIQSCTRVSNQAISNKHFPCYISKLTCWQDVSLKTKYWPM